MGIKDFIRVTPGEFYPEDPEQAVKEIWELRREFRLGDIADKWYLDHVHGVFYVRKYLEPLVSKVHDPQEYESIRQQYESVIEITKSGNEVKTFFREFLDKLKDKSQDEIIEEIFAGLRRYGPAVFAVFIQGSGPSPDIPPSL